MFCDLVGSTALSTRLDPEDLREIFSAYRRCCADVITGLGGYVAKYMSDGVLAYFGYPRVHEDDAGKSLWRPNRSDPKVETSIERELVLVVECEARVLVLLA